MAEEHRRIASVLLPEFIALMNQWAKEYKQPRNLGARGEFVGMHRKTEKIKTAIWEGEDTSDWREQPRTILFEIACHAFLMICDLDAEERELEEEPVCSAACDSGHTYGALCELQGLGLK